MWDQCYIDLVSKQNSRFGVWHILLWFLPSLYFEPQSFVTPHTTTPSHPWNCHGHHLDYDIPTSFHFLPPINKGHPNRLLEQPYNFAPSPYQFLCISQKGSSHPLQNSPQKGSFSADLVPNLQLIFSPSAPFPKPEEDSMSHWPQQSHWDLSFDSIMSSPTNLNMVF